MVRRKDLLGDDERRSIEETIAEAERRTSAEFVVVVARRSGRYDRSEDLFGLLLACVVLSVISIVWRSPGPVGSWDTTLRIPLGLPLTLVAIAAAFAFLARPVEDEQEPAEAPAVAQAPM